MSKDGEEDYVLEQVEVDDSDDDFQYEELVVDDDDEHGEAEESLQVALKNLAKSQAQATIIKSDSDDKEVTQPEVLDDFVRNFLTKMKMEKTLEQFQQEWYDKEQRGDLDPEAVGVVPDAYARNKVYKEEIEKLRLQLNETKGVAEKAQAMWEKLRKERDFHRMHHKRVAQEKNKLIVDLKRVKKHYSNYEPAMSQLKEKYEAAMKSKMLARLDRDKLAAELEQLKNHVVQRGDEVEDDHKAKAKPVAKAAPAKNVAASGTAGTRTRNAAPKKAPVVKESTRQKNDSHWPKEGQKYVEVMMEPAPVNQYKPTALYKAHSMAVSAVAIHPTKPLVGTASDDGMWKVWSLKSGELVISGSDHDDWIGGIDFHPRGSHVATSSGDGTVKMWSFDTNSCSTTFKDHKSAVWGLKFHNSGDFLGTASMDHTIKLWDLKSNRCRQTLRGHMDSVNAIDFSPNGFLMASASGDKTVSVWDPRTGLCVQTFFGHLNACIGVAFSIKGDVVASTDADGIVKLWDARMVAERAGITTGSQPANMCKFDSSGRILAVASDDGTCKMFDIQEGRHLVDFDAHEGSCECIAFDPNDQFLVTGGEDCNFRVFS